jgi:quercetin dioxygenase-like cupin family protein
MMDSVASGAYRSLIKQRFRAVAETVGVWQLLQEGRGPHEMTRTMTAAVLIVATGLAPHVARAQDAGPAGIKRTDLQRHDLSAPGREAVQVRVDFAPGAAFGKHRHPGEEIIYVLEGSLEYEVDGKPTTTLKAGDVLFIPAGTIHAAKNVGSGNAGELATYVVEKGKPLVELVK